MKAGSKTDKNLNFKRAAMSSKKSLEIVRIPPANSGLAGVGAKPP
jgi:hypothetical protein